MCLILSLGTPVSILADEPSAGVEISEQADNGSDEVSEPEAEEPGSEPVSEPAAEETVTEPETESETEPAAADISDPAGGDNKVINPEYTDAEKYMASGYDEQLCWAATAANMLWTGNYAQSAINPQTDDYFANEDEVMDYFRKCFTDEAGVPDGAIEYFREGTYQYAGEEGISQLRADAPPGGLLRDCVEDGDVAVVGNSSVPNLLDELRDLEGLSAGGLLKWWDIIHETVLSGAHWLTIAGLVSGGQYGYEGIWLADSDNDPARNTHPGVTDPALRAQYAAEMPNSYTYYPLTYEEIDNAFFWIINGFDSDPRYKVILTHICYLLAMEEESADTDDEDDDSDETEDKSNVTEPAAVNVPAYTDKQIMEYVFTTLKARMIEEGLQVYSPTGNVYDRSSDTGYSLVVMRAETQLLNVYVDGIRLDMSGRYYTITINPQGLFTITFTKEFLQTLKNGKHVIRMEFDRAGDITSSFDIK